MKYKNHKIIYPLAAVLAIICLQGCSYYPGNSILPTGPSSESAEKYTASSDVSAYSADSDTAFIISLNNKAPEIPGAISYVADGITDSAKLYIEEHYPESNHTDTDTGTVTPGNAQPHPGITVNATDNTQPDITDNVSGKNPSDAANDVSDGRQSDSTQTDNTIDSFANVSTDDMNSDINNYYEDYAIPDSYIGDESLTPSYRDYENGESISLSPSWHYADYSVINTGTATYYRAENNRNGFTICVNAGHGTSHVGNKKTFCHPDESPKVTGGTTGAGATMATAISTGMDFLDGTPEAKVTLAMAMILKQKLLIAGYDVLMIRESDDVQLDNIARTVIANNCSDCHIALHWDSTENDKGAFYMAVPNVKSYKNMEPVSLVWEKHERLGKNLIKGLSDVGVKIFEDGALEMDLTQTSYSTVPSIDIELGDSASDHSDSTLDKLGDGLVAGIRFFFGK